jgi:hypothetical protein
MKDALSLGYLGRAEGIDAWYRVAVDLFRLQAIRDGERYASVLLIALGTWT